MSDSASGVDLSNLYSNGDVILSSPIESSTIFLLIVVVSASIEYLFGIAREVDSDFFRQMFGAITEEVLVVGVLSLLLTFVSSLISSLPSQWELMFKWAHICLFFMATIFIVVVCGVLVASLSQHKAWKKFELSRMKVAESFDGREQKFKLSWEKFCVALRAYGYDTQVSFASYVFRSERLNLVALTNLTWKSWLALSVLVVLNALRTKLIPTTHNPDDPAQVLSDNDALLNIIAFLLLCGLGILIVFFYIHFTLQQRFRQYLMLTITKHGDPSAPLVVRKTDLDDPQSFLLFQSLPSTIAALQMLLVCLVWYLSVFFLNLMYTTFSYNFGLTIVIIVAAISPAIVFVAFIPWTITTVSILSTLGTNLQEAYIAELLGATTSAAPSLPQRDTAPSPTNTSAHQVQVVQMRPLRPVIIDDSTLMHLANSESARGQVSASMSTVPSPPRRLQRPLADL